jgi:cytochrome c biogenesis protein CcdA
MVEVSLLAAFFGGVLSLLSPCSALLLPAFFAYAFSGGGELVGKTGLFYLGLAATLVPLGMGISAVSTLFYGHRTALITISGVLLIGFGFLQLLGRGFTAGPLACAPASGATPRAPSSPLAPSTASRVSAPVRYWARC